LVTEELARAVRTESAAAAGRRRACEGRAEVVEGSGSRLGSG
jgi:hypothetical protein